MEIIIDDARRTFRGEKQFVLATMHATMHGGVHTSTEPSTDNVTDPSTDNATDNATDGATDGATHNATAPDAPDAAERESSQTDSTGDSTARPSTTELDQAQDRTPWPLVRLLSALSVSGERSRQRPGAEGRAGPRANRDQTQTPAGKFGVGAETGAEAEADAGVAATGSGTAKLFGPVTPAEATTEEATGANESSESSSSGGGASMAVSEQERGRRGYVQGLNTLGGIRCLTVLAPLTQHRTRPPPPLHSLCNKTAPPSRPIPSHRIH